MKEKLVEAVHDGGLTKNWHNVAGMSSSKFSYTKSKTCMRNILEELQKNFRSTSEAFQKHWLCLVVEYVVKRDSMVPDKSACSQIRIDKRGG